MERRVGPSGKVRGIDASPEMIARAKKKASKAVVSFENMFVQQLPFSDATFDVVLSVTMLHHLSRKARHQCFLEVRRVRRSWIARFHHHGKIDLSQM